MSDTDVGSTVAGFVKEQLVVNKEKKAKAAAAAASARKKGAIIASIAIVIIGCALWFMYDRMQPPGFVKVTDVAVQGNAATSTAVVTGKIKNMTNRTIAEGTWVVSFYEPTKAKKAVVEVPFTLKDIKVGEGREFKVEVTSWRPDLRYVVHKKDAGGTT